MINSIYSNSSYYTSLANSRLLNTSTTSAKTKDGSTSYSDLSLSSTDSSTDTTYVPVDDHFGMMQSYQKVPRIPSVSTDEESETDDTSTTSASIDTDGDGTISADEYDEFMSNMGITNAPSSEDFFAHYDTDSDGEITSAELEANKPVGPPPKEKAQNLSSSIDADGDGTISTDEYDELMKEMGITNAPSADEFFTQYDTNSDGEITAAEMDASKPTKAPTVNIPTDETQAFSSDIDVDGDGSISTDEYESLVSQMGVDDALSSTDFFEKYDTDSDGKLTTDEITAAYNNYIKAASNTLNAYETNYDYAFDQNSTNFNTSI